MKTVLIFGASVTWGAWDSEKGGWVNRLRLFIEDGYEDIDVYNLGISGDNIEGLLDRFENEVTARTEGELILIFSVGDNDSAKNSDKSLPLEEFKTKLKKLVEISKRYTEKIIFLGIRGLDESRTHSFGEDGMASYSLKDLKEYNNEVKKVALEENVYFLEMKELLKDEEFEDGLHPNSEGHDKIYNDVRDFLIEKELLK
jgi:lysophospholipase L1-like esterase